MRFKNIKTSILLIHIIITIAYPLLKYAGSNADKLLVFTDALTLTSFIMIIIGIFYSMYLKGDFDLTSYIMNHSINKKSTKPVESFLKDSKKEREESFNYPLFVGFLGLITCIVITKVYY